MPLERNCRFKRQKTIWITVVIVFLILCAAFLYIGFYYTSYFGQRNYFLGYDPISANISTNTFYLFHEKVYAPVRYSVKGRIDTTQIPDYIGSPAENVEELRFDGNPLIIKRNRGERLGEVEGDFVYDTDEAMHHVELYTLLSDGQKPISGILWAESDGLPYLVAEITKPYSRKMLYVDKWDDYAVDVFLTLYGKSGFIWDPHFGLSPGTSKYFNKIDDGRWFNFKMNLYFFYYDIFG